MNRSPGLLFAFCTLNAPCASAQVREVITIELPGGLSERVYPYWTVFLHPRFGYELPVPPGVRALGIPETTTESKFVSPDGSFVMWAWGGMSPEPAASLIESQWTQAQSRPGRAISCQRKSQSWFVISGTDKAGNEFYEKFTMRGGHVASLTINYPRTRLREFKTWVEEIEDGFRTVALPVGSPEIAPRLLSGTLHSNIESWKIPDISRQVVPSSPGSGESHGPDRFLGDSRAVPDTTVDLTPPPKRIETEFPPAKLEPVKSEVSDAVNTSPEKQPGGEATPARQDLPIGQKVVGKPGFVYSPFLWEKRLVDVVDIAPGTKVKCPYTEKIFRVP